MRRRPTLAGLAALCSLMIVFAGCGGDDDSDSTGSTTTAEAAETTTAPEAEEAEVDCEAYTTVVGLFADVEAIAQGSSDAQVAADEALADGLATLAPSGEGDEFVTEALATLGQVSFQVTDEDTGPSSDEIDSAIVTIQDAWSSQCPTPPADEGDDAVEETPTAEVPECPAPEVLEAEGFACDSEGNLTPLDEETVTECPAPEVLEAEGFTCDSEGHLTPVEGAATPEEEPPADEPVECPAPEVLEEQGLTCDSEGNLTPIE